MRERPGGGGGAEEDWVRERELSFSSVQSLSRVRFFATP